MIFIERKMAIKGTIIHMELKNKAGMMIEKTTQDHHLVQKILFKDQQLKIMNIQIRKSLL